MPIAEIMAGISLVKASVDFIKSNIDTAKDIGEIAGAVDGLFRGQEDINKKRSKNAGVGVADQLGIKTVAQEVIDAKLAQEKMQEMKNLINMRFGPDTWQTIVDLRAKKIQEEREAIAAVKRKKREEAREFEEMIKQAAIVAVVVGAAISLFVFLFVVVL
jgi:RNase H-fold protein (predicted Holliday junction resolvase)